MTGSEQPDVRASADRSLAESSRRKQGAAEPRIRRDFESLLTALARIEDRLSRVAASEHADFYDGTPSYDAAMLAIIRLHALRESTEYSAVFEVLGPDEWRGLSRMRNIASHARYESMDDALLWDAATRLLPKLLPRLRASATQRLRSHR